MTAALALPASSRTRAFLGVERSACERLWRDRLDDLGQSRALAMAQRHGVLELLARILAGRGVEVDQVAGYLDPTVRALMPDPEVLRDMDTAAARLPERCPRDTIRPDATSQARPHPATRRDPRD